MMPSFDEVAPVCLPLFTGDNGGATDEGVTAEEITLVMYYPPSDPASTAVLGSVGLAGDRDDVEYVTEMARRYYNVHRETYGREIKVVSVAGSGTDPQSQKADAIEIAQTIKPFAVSGGGYAFAEEINARGVICFCLALQTRSYTRRFPGLSWTGLPTAEAYYENVAEYIGRRGLVGSPASYAGPPPIGAPNYNDQRRFGLVYLSTGLDGAPDPGLDVAADHFEAELAKYGARLETRVSYRYDIPQFQQAATNVIAQLRTANVNNVILFTDPVFPITLTNEAARQGYSPEWLQTGTLLTDWAVFARSYNQDQWSHSFGLSAFPLTPSDFHDLTIWHVYLHGGGDPDRDLTIADFGNPMATLADGVHLAGPHLTRETWARGLYLAGTRGGKGYFPRVKFTELDPTALFDFAEVWWDPDRPSRDEIGNEGIGTLVRADGNKRHGVGEWPTVAPYVFDADPNPTTTIEDTSIAYDHTADGHSHPDGQRCRSCQ